MLKLVAPKSLHHQCCASCRYAECFGSGVDNGLDSKTFLGTGAWSTRNIFALVHAFGLGLLGAKASATRWIMYVLH